MAGVTPDVTPCVTLGVACDASVVGMGITLVLPLDATAAGMLGATLGATPCVTLLWPTAGARFGIGAAPAGIDVTGAADWLTAGVVTDGVTGATVGILVGVTDDVAVGTIAGVTAGCGGAGRSHCEVLVTRLK